MWNCWHLEIEHIWCWSSEAGVSQPELIACGEWCWWLILSEQWLGDPHKHWPLTSSCLFWILSGCFYFYFPEEVCAVREDTECCYILDAANPIPQATPASRDCSSYAVSTGCQPQPEGSWDVLVLECVCAFLTPRFHGIDVLGTCEARVSFLKEVHFWECLRNVLGTCLCHLSCVDSKAFMREQNLLRPSWNMNSKLSSYSRRTLPGTLLF